MHSIHTRSVTVIVVPANKTIARPDRKLHTVTTVEPRVTDTSSGDTSMFRNFEILCMYCNVLLTIMQKLTLYSDELR